jgi:hypothetical protein
MITKLRASASDYLHQCGTTLCYSWANLYNGANMAGRKQNTKIMAMVKIKKLKNILIKNTCNQYRSVIG